MKVKTLRPHYYEGNYKVVGSEYVCDKLHFEKVIRRELCEEVKPKQKKGRPKRSKKEQ